MNFFIDNRTKIGANYNNGVINIVPKNDSNFSGGNQQINIIVLPQTQKDCQKCQTIMPVLLGFAVGSSIGAPITGSLIGSAVAIMNSKWSPE